MKLSQYTILFIINSPTSTIRLKTTTKQLLGKRRGPSIDNIWWMISTTLRDTNSEACQLEKKKTPSTHVIVSYGKKLLTIPEASHNTMSCEFSTCLWETHY